MQMSHKRIRLRSMKRLALWVAAVIMFACLGITYLRQESMAATQAQERARLEAQIEELSQHNQELERSIDSADTNDYRARIARQELGYVQEKEIRFVEKEG